MRELIVRFLRDLDALCGFLVLLFLVVSFAVVGKLDEARPDRARLDMMNVCGGLRLYREKHKAEPIDLRALVDTDTLEKVPKDPWGNDYALETSSRGPAIWTYGSDGAPGGTESAADLRYECMSGLEMRSGER